MVSEINKDLTAGEMIDFLNELRNCFIIDATHHFIGLQKLDNDELDDTMEEVAEETAMFLYDVLM